MSQIEGLTRNERKSYDSINKNLANKREPQNIQNFVPNSVASNEVFLSIHTNNVTEEEVRKKSEYTYVDWRGDHSIHTINLYDEFGLKDLNIPAYVKNAMIDYIKNNNLGYYATQEYINLIKNNESDRALIDLFTSQLENVEKEASEMSDRQLQVMANGYEADGTEFLDDLPIYINYQTGKKYYLSFHSSTDDKRQFGTLSREEQEAVRNLPGFEEIRREAARKYYIDTKKSQIEAAISTFEHDMAENNNRISNELPYLSVDFERYRKTNQISSIENKVGKYPVTDDYTEIWRLMGEDIDNGKLSIFELCVKLTNSNIDIANFAASYNNDKTMIINNILLKGFKYLTDEQKEVLNYLLDKKGTEEAIKYLDSLEDTINEEKGRRNAESFIESLESYGKSEYIADKIYQRLYTLLQGTGNGLENWLDNVSNIFCADGKPSANDYEIAIILYYLNQTGQTNLLNTYNLGKSFGNALPSITMTAVAATCGMHGTALRLFMTAVTGLEAFGQVLDDKIDDYGKSGAIIYSFINAVATGSWNFILAKAIFASEYSFLTNVSTQFSINLSKEMVAGLSESIFDSIYCNKPINFSDLSKTFGISAGKALYLTLTSVALIKLGNSSKETATIFVCATEGGKKLFKVSADDIKNYFLEKDLDFETLSQQELDKILEEIGTPTN